MNKWWLLAFVIWSVSMFGAGARWEIIKDRADKGEQLGKEVTATTAAQKGTDALVAGSEAKINTLTTNAETLKEELNAEQIRHPSACAVPDPVFKLLESTARAARGS